MKVNSELTFTRKYHINQFCRQGLRFQIDFEHCVRHFLKASLCNHYYQNIKKKTRRKQKCIRLYFEIWRKIIIIHQRRVTKNGWEEKNNMVTCMRKTREHRKRTKKGLKNRSWTVTAVFISTLALRLQLHPVRYAKIRWKQMKTLTRLRIFLVIHHLMLGGLISERTKNHEN